MDATINLPYSLSCVVFAVHLKSSQLDTTPPDIKGDATEFSLGEQLKKPFILNHNAHQLAPEFKGGTKLQIDIVKVRRRLRKEIRRWSSVFTQ